jgi:hypothetical protein
MTKFKTNEEYILNELYKAQEELQLANKKIEELEEQLRNPRTDEDMNCIYLSDKPNYWYHIDTTGVYNWNKILKDNNKKPEFVEEALKDEKKLLKLCSLKEKTSSWSPYQIGTLDERLYNYLFKDRKGRYSIITLTDAHTYFYECSDTTFLHKEEAQAQLLEEVRKNAERYLKDYKDKYDEVK